MNTVWTVDSTFTYLGLETGPCCSSDVPAILLEFLDRTNGNGNADNLEIAASNGLSLPILPLTDVAVLPWLHL
jgi:hypothetical protein